MKKICILALFVFVLLVYTQQAHAKKNAAEQCVRKFYTWYITEDLKEDAYLNHPLDNPDIYKYVYHCTVNNIRIFYARGYFDADYFTKSQDVWDKWLDAMVVHKEIKLTETVSIVPVSFQSRPDFEPHTIIAFVQKENGRFYVTKLVGTNHFYE